MKRWMAKEIIAHWNYLLRKECGLEDYGSADTDQAEAEKIIEFFDNEKSMYKGLDYAAQKDDYNRFRPIYNLIDNQIDNHIDKEESDARDTE